MFSEIILLLSWQTLPIPVDIRPRSSANKTLSFGHVSIETPSNSRNILTWFSYGLRANTFLFRKFKVIVINIKSIWKVGFFDGSEYRHIISNICKVKVTF